MMLESFNMQAIDNDIEYWEGSDAVFSCLIDRKRVWTFRRAIKSAVKKGDIVADFGTGTGILALLAADQGAKKVYAVEIDGNLHKNLESTFQLNKYQETIQLIKGDARKITLPEKFDVAICEMISTGLLHETQVSAINNILRFAKKNTKIIPAGMNNYVDLVYNSNSFYGHKMHIVRHEYPEYSYLRSKPFSDKVLYAAVNFYTLNDLQIDKKIPLTITKKGIINGIRISSQTLFPDDAISDDSPTYSYPLILPMKDKRVEKGDTFLLHLSYKMGGGQRNLSYSLTRS